MKSGGTARIRPDQVYAWRGPSLLLTNDRGECGEDDPLSGFYFREARHLRTLRLEVNGERPWLCEVGAFAPDALDFVFVHPERTRFGGGGSGQSGGEVETDARGIPYRALDLRLGYRVRIASLEVSLAIANGSDREVEVLLSWFLGADFADLQEAHGGSREQNAGVDAVAENPALSFRYLHPNLSLATRVSPWEGRAWKF
ncbi:MAG: glycogen debranching N-terminal domain-containing protein, partial [Thermoanaerobaculia bacterium]